MQKERKEEKSLSKIIKHAKNLAIYLAVMKTEVLGIGVLLDWWLVRKVGFLARENFE